jgi:hypothetical protein
MSPKNPPSDRFTTGVDEIFRITNHLQGRMSIYLAEASVLEDRAHRSPSIDEKMALQGELISLDVLLHQLNDVIETRDALGTVEDRNKFAADLSQVVRHYLRTVKPNQDEGPRKSTKYKTVFTEPKIETSLEYMLRWMRED